MAEGVDPHRYEQAADDLLTLPDWTPRQAWELLHQEVAPTGTATPPESAAVGTRRRLRRELVRRMATLPEAEEREVLQELTIDLQRCFERIVTAEPRPARAVVAALQELAADLLWLRSRLDAVTRDPDADPLSELLAEVDWCTDAVRRLVRLPRSQRPDAQSLARLRAGLEHASVVALRQRLQGLEVLLRPGPGAVDGGGVPAATGMAKLPLDTLWRAHVLSGDLEDELNRLAAAAASNLQEEVQHLERQRAAIRKALEVRLQGLSPDERAQALPGLALDLVDRSEDLQVALGEDAPAVGLANLQEMERELTWGEELLTAEQPELRRLSAPLVGRLGARTPVEQAYVALLRARRRTLNEFVESTVTFRLEGLIGRRLAGWFETLIMVLLFAFIVLLWLEMGLTRGIHDAHQLLASDRIGPGVMEMARYMLHVHMVFGYADLIICVVFLFEFFLKLGLAPRRLNYFVRHALIDFFPSIPFGFITYAAMHAAVPTATEGARFLRVLRLMRLPRLIRYLRVARPLVRLLRLCSFAMRGADRLVRRNAARLNRNVVFFDPEPPRALDSSDLREGFVGLSGRVVRRLRGQLRQLSPEARCQALERWLEELAGHLPERQLVRADQPVAEPGRRLPQREIRFEEILAGMVQMDAVGVEDLLGRDRVMKLRRLLVLMCAPVVRWLPVVRDMVANIDRLDPYELVAQALRVLGSSGERILARIHAVCDLKGVVTPSDLLDRVGGAMAKALGRPAKRLILFGILFLILKYLLGFLPFLAGVATFFGKVLSNAFLVIGAICLVIMAIGIWLRRLAGQISEFYSRVAEAQFIGLVKGTKGATLEQDLRLIGERVRRPETLVEGTEPTTSPIAADLSQLANRLRQMLPHEVPARDPDSTAEDPRATSRSWAGRDRLLMLYRDYLDGAPLHRSGVKVANQFLGNLVIENIHRERLGLTRRELRQLERLDLSRERRLFGGPNMWFRFITDSISQEIARLTVEYNQHCLNLQEQALADPEELAVFHEWLARRRRELEEDAPGSVVRDEGESLTAAQRRIRERPYLTTMFTALHFLTAEANRDLMVGETFGVEVMRQLQRDRAHVIRRVFGTHSLSTLPRSQRTFNLYRLYQQYMAGGRVLLVPLRLGWTWLRAVGWVVGMVVRNVRAIRDPGLLTSRPRDGYAGFDVAERKICRMRKPNYMATMRTRARFDPEYLGLAIPGTECSCPPEHNFRADLDRIGALEEERQWFEDLHRQRRRALTRFRLELRRRGFQGAGLQEKLGVLGGAVAARNPFEALRAMMVAYLIDHRHTASLLHGEEEIERILTEAVQQGQGNGEDDPAHPGPRRRLGVQASLTLSRSRRVAFNRWWRDAAGGEHRSREERNLCLEAFAANTGGVRDLILVQLEAGGPEQARRRGWAQLEETARRPSTWSEQILTLRMIQTLTVMDLQCYRRLVRQLGCYDADQVQPRAAAAGDLPRGGA